MTTPNDRALFRPPLTFMGVPASTDATGAGAAILGCPFDCGTHPFRIGSRQGPQAIREQSPLLQRYQSELADQDILADLGVIDAGDVNVVPSRAEEAFPLIEEAAYRLGSAGAATVGFGGDGSISLPLVRAAARIHPDLVVLHIDSHTDAYPVDPVHRYDPATQFTHAALEQRVRPSASFHVGVRGNAMRQGVYDYARDLGYNLVTMRDFQRRGAEDVLGEIRTAIGSRPVYLSFDMDVFDPSCAPGVCTPSWGGFTAREGLELLRALAGLSIVAADVNTVSPPHDVNGMTAFLAAAVTFEILLLVWRARRDEAD
ncbi:arginase family protein [Acuticoccus mangrovi]|uniref:Arginase family protein n=1 Tax=Acuticoccus mangrovi TaxID=2796142 RepID=A0A934MC45_9HYPH|nr:arginase family protein [Acuticoccus mangrovi]MBJ3774867.1 arginase family protein [Acuticoccus mangrovi]